jgi:hypothetical protein
MSNQVNWKELFDDKTNVFRCETLEESMELSAIADRLGFKWSNGDGYLTNNYWHVHESDTCYAIGIGEYCEEDFYVQGGYTIHKFSELVKQDKMKKGFTKQDFLDKKVAIEWESDKAVKINTFFKECHKDNTRATGPSPYYFTKRTTNPGYYEGCNSLEALAEEGITEIYTIDQLIKETTMGTQTISRQNLGKIYPDVCSKWKGKIDEVLAEQKFATEIEVADSVLKEAFREANSDQKTALRRYFKEPKPSFQPKDLKIGEIMKVTGKVDDSILGKHIMRIYERLVCLENPSQTWDNIDTCAIEGTKLAAGSSVLITAK